MAPGRVYTYHLVADKLYSRVFQGKLVHRSGDMREGGQRVCGAVVVGKYI